MEFFAHQLFFYLLIQKLNLVLGKDFETIYCILVNVCKINYLIAVPNLIVFTLSYHEEVPSL